MGENQPKLSSVARMQPGDHSCNIYRTDAEQRAITVDFVRHGIAKHERMLYIANFQTAGQLRETLISAGIPVDELVASGQLVIQTAKEAYLCDGLFDPDKMIELLGQAGASAVRDGFSALRITGEMTWALAGVPGSERLVEYEAKLNRFFPGSNCHAICQYDRRRFDSEMLLDILHTHPKVMLGETAFDNADMYFVPPESFLAADRQGALLERWTHNLSKREPV
jgi:hypothetical protein